MKRDIIKSVYDICTRQIKCECDFNVYIYEKTDMCIVKHEYNRMCFYTHTHTQNYFYNNSKLIREKKIYFLPSTRIAIRTFLSLNS